MNSSGKIVDRKKEYRSIGESDEIRQAADQRASSIIEIDLSFNQIDNVQGLDKFPNLKTLILDHNNLATVNTFPSLPKLDTLSLSYNAIRNLDVFLTQVDQKFPSLRHLNVMKNPMNPMFEEESKYEEFRATVKIWLPLLNTLDGTGFLENIEAIRSKYKDIEAKKAKVMQSNKGGKQLQSIPEEPKGWNTSPRGNNQKNVAEDDILNDLKKKKGTYQFNQRAYKKYHSTRSLVERILKSHSEGNRFIRNDDL